MVGPKIEAGTGGEPMALNIPILRESFALVVQRQPQMTQRFYEILFERYPQARPLFGGNASAKQEKMLTEALTAVMDHLDDAAWLKDTLAGLGKKHVGYGITREMYGWVGDSLLATLVEVAGDQWNPELAAAWIEAYGAISSLMQAGARKA
jgi:hemoglobin-like flavoprotein